MNYKDDTSEMIRTQLEKMEAGERKLRQERESAVMAFMRALEKIFSLEFFEKRKKTKAPYIFINETILESQREKMPSKAVDQEYERTKQILTEKVVNRYIQELESESKRFINLDDALESLSRDSSRESDAYYYEEMEIDH